MITYVIILGDNMLISNQAKYDLWLLSEKVPLFLSCFLLILYFFIGFFLNMF